MKLSVRGGFSGGAVARYMLLPGIIPWLKKLSRQISEIFFIFSQILGITNLIDSNHPCLRPENRDQYSCVDVILLAWSNLRFTRKNLPDILMFFAVVMTLVLFVALAGTSLLYVFFSFGDAHAQYLGTPNTSIPYDVNNDWAFQFLDRIFGGQVNTGINFWVQGESPAMIGNPWLSAILSGMLKLYSQAMMVIAAFMILYIIMTTLADAARSGRPFGSGFDGIWAPIRFALAIGLLVPFSGTGYNGAQLIVFQTAEMGSNMATNIWHRTLEDFGNCGANGSSGRCNFVSDAVSDYGYKFLRDVFLVNLCIYGYNAQLQDGAIPDKNAEMNVFRVSQNRTSEIYSFGNKDVVDFCGQVSIPKMMTILDIPPGYLAPSSSGGTQRTEDNFLPRLIVDGYREGALMFLPPGGQMQEVATNFAKDAFCKQDQLLMNIDCAEGQSCAVKVKDWIQTYWRVGMGRRTTSNEVGTHFFEAYGDAVGAYNNWIVDALKKDAEHGWATAGVFYLRMSSAINIVSRAISESPRVIKLPANYYKMNATPINPTIDDAVAKDRCDGLFSSGTGDECDSYKAAQALYELINKGKEWFRVAPRVDTAFYAQLDPTAYQSALKTPDGEQVSSVTPDSQLSPLTNYIFEHIRMGNQEVNPLGVVIEWGDTMFTVASMAYSIAIAASILSFIPGWGAALEALASFCESIGNLLVIPGFTLMFIVPFMPFLYFTFAVVEWVVSVLEAVIGMPLWVLTLIKREGDLLGPAMSGVKMLFEIMLRPVMIIFSLIAAIIIFSAGVIFFEEAMALYMGVYESNVSSGFAMGPVVGLALIFVYMFGIYSLAMSCFKLIEAIPDKFGRWFSLDAGFGARVHMGETNTYAIAAAALGGIAAANSIRRDATNLTRNTIASLMPKKKPDVDTDESLPGVVPAPSGGPSSGGGGTGTGGTGTGGGGTRGSATGGGTGGSGTGGGGPSTGGGSTGTGYGGGAYGFSGGGSGGSGSSGTGTGGGTSGGGGSTSGSRGNGNQFGGGSSNFNQQYSNFGSGSEFNWAKFDSYSQSEKDRQSYKMLDVPTYATVKEIKSAYRKALLKYHPDRYKGKDAADKIAALSKSYNHIKQRRNDEKW